MIEDKTMGHPWYKFYAPSVPHEINPDAYPSLIELMERSFVHNKDLKAYTNMDKSLTFGELDRLSQYFAAYLQSIGLVAGDRIAIQMPNLLQFPVAMFGAIRAGLVIVNTNPLYTSREMLHQFKDSGAKAIVILANFAVNLEKIVDQTDIKHVIVTEIGDMLGFPKRILVNAVVKYVKKMVPSYTLDKKVSFLSTLAKGEHLPYQRPQRKGNDLAFIQYTGGTTGVSKGACLTHRNLLANVEAVNEWLMSSFRTNQFSGQITLVAPLPLYHVFAMTVNALCALKWGGHNVLITNPRDLPAFIKEWKKYDIHIFPGLNTLFNSMLNNAAFRALDFSSLKITIAGGMALQQVVAENWYKVTGCHLVEGYGLSETSPVLSVNPLNGKQRVGTIGVPIPSTELRVLKDDETWAAIGERGEICAQGPQVMEGYFNRPEETKKVFFEDESGKWFRTGDIGVKDEDGFFKIVDRKKDMILVSGFNVYPNEIEDVMAKCPGVLEVACVGVPDEHSGEAVRLFIVKSDPSLTEEGVVAYCKENFTGYKRPKSIIFKTELPKSNVGKILRRTLREESLQHPA
ncbi:long-chain acyl-CoA synthetase [Dyadobacter jejuensis]|uniref:Long-chain-fatty-acid--CoA ligase n=1 Tax=Dyadobacter jejuensis TaxID=1082580 RepID=A0A316AKJ7_9BACT|nr:AMP-binding protein [Dyadobacter jejuensis]PWJ57544.1 long-chain acyl-CoA synthetase [Dyadobacter jejuensis]